VWCDHAVPILLEDIMNHLIAFTVLLLATPPENKLTVGVAHFPPMVIVDSKSGNLSGGYDLELFQELSRLIDSMNDGYTEKQWKYEYKIANSFSSLLTEVAEGKVDVALAGISITQDRLERLGLNFSQPYEYSGQRIMVPYGEVSLSDKAVAYVSQFFRLEILFALIAFILNCFFWGFIVCIVERFFWKRKHPPSNGTKDIVHVNGERPNIENWEHYYSIMKDLGALKDPTKCWWLVRLNPVGTIELRIADSTENYNTIEKIISKFCSLIEEIL